MGLRDRLNKMAGKTRIVVTRLMIHLGGSEVAPLLGLLNRTAREAIEADGDLEVVGEGLADICQSLLQYQTNWMAAANEGDVFWEEEDAEELVNELFTDSAQRYMSQPHYGLGTDEEESLSLPITTNLLIMLTVAFEGEDPDLETNLASIEAMEEGLKALINLHHQEQLRAVQVHFSPARLGDELTNEQVLINFPELIPL